MVQLSVALGQQLSVAEIGFVSRDIVGEVIQFFRNPAQHLLQVGLEGYVRQSPGMVGLDMTAGCAAHTDETPPSGERSPCSC